MNIVSASRRTDIPQFFGDWFAARRKAGWCESRNVYGGRYRISLRPEDVIGYLFWSKNTAPFEAQISGLREEGTPVAVQFTLTGYGPAVETNVPGPRVTIPAFLRAAAMLPSPASIQWRYDPVVVTETFDEDWHRRNFRRIASALEGATRVCNASFVEPYLKVVRRTGETERRLIRELSEIAGEHGIELRSCCDPWIGLPPSSCCGAELFEGYGIGERLRPLKPGPTRKGCRCLASRDIGMDDTCPGGCLFCYVTRSPEAVERNLRRYRDDSVRLR